MMPDINTEEKVCSLDGDKDFINIVTSDLERNTLKYL